MRAAFAAILLLSVSGAAFAASHKDDTTPSPTTPEVTAPPTHSGGMPAPPNNIPTPSFPSIPSVTGQAPSGMSPGVFSAHGPSGGTPSGNPHGGGHSGGWDGGPSVPGGIHSGGGQHDGRGSHDGRDGDRGDRHHRGHGGILFPWPPYPTTWPYPPYPYPPGSFWYDYSDSDDDAPRQGPTVPADLPNATAPAFWFYCDAPDGYYPYVKSCSHTWNIIPISPPPPGAAAPISYSDWQWCEETKSFFPYVSSCHAGFVSIPVTAPNAESAGPPAAANWFFCDDPKGYLPYVIQCKHDWRAVPSVPPPSVKITVKSDPVKTEKGK